MPEIADEATKVLLFNFRGKGISRRVKNINRDRASSRPILWTHTCLGAGVAEVQLMVTVGALLRAVRLELDTPDYEIKTKLLPIPGPDPRFKIRVMEQRKV